MPEAVTGLPDWLIPLIGGNTLVSAALGYLIPAFVARKKDAGELASDLLAQCLERIARLEREKDDCQQATALIERRCERHEIVLRLTISELQLHAADSPVLAQARALMGERPAAWATSQPDGGSADARVA